MENSEYLIREARKADPHGRGRGITIKIRGEEGESRWLALDRGQWMRILVVLADPAYDTDGDWGTLRDPVRPAQGPEGPARDA